jgi:hypothetical protein
MRFIPTRVHAVIDYIVTVILLGLPYLFDAWAGGGAKVWVPMALGIATIIYSLLTSYKLGVLPILSMPVHLVLDASSGLVLALSPYLFGFNGQVSEPYVLLGLFEIAASLMTQTRQGSLPGPQHDGLKASRPNPARPNPGHDERNIHRA